MPPVVLDDVDRRLLDALQRAVPLDARPFAALGNSLGISEAEVLSRLQRLRAPGGVIRQISAIFDSRALGYESCLVGAQVDDRHIDQAAAIISSHPGVSHNYRRDHAFNLWYTLTVPPDSTLGLPRTADLLHTLSGCRVTRLMPTLRMYKIGVRFDLSNEPPPPSTMLAARETAPLHIADADRRIIRMLQQDLPLIAQPFHAWAEEAQVGVDELLAAARAYLERGAMRRFAAVLHHRQAGFSANAMGAWIVPPEQHDRFGATAAGFDAVSHCYLRPTYPDWPYALFTMVHGRDRAACERTLADIAAATGIVNYVALYSTQEYKKVRVRYMTDEIVAWEKECAGRVPASAES
jgi:siroheme decarboxylase